MSVYLGTFGQVELRRQFEDTDLRSTVNTSDVNVTRKRLSFDFQRGQLITGDQVEITSTDGSALSFIDSYTKTSIKRFINVDELGGIRLYTAYADAINGALANAITLAVPSANVPIRVSVEDSDFRIVAQVNSFELNTQRETVDNGTVRRLSQSDQSIDVWLWPDVLLLGIYRRNSQSSPAILVATCFAYKSRQ